MPNKKKRRGRDAYRASSWAKTFNAHWRWWGGLGLLALALIPVVLFAVLRRPDVPSDPIWTEFSGQRALGHVQRLVGLGPRPPASEAIQKARAYIRQNLEANGWQVIEQPFTDDTPRGRVAFVNLIARRPNQSERTKLSSLLRTTTRRSSIRSNSSERMMAARAPVRCSKWGASSISIRIWPHRLS